VLRAGIALIHQEISLVQHLTVAENLSLGDEPRGRFGLLDRAAAVGRARALLAPLDDRLDPVARVESLSIAEQQVVEIARALRHEVRVLVMDEPTAALTEREAERLFAAIEEVRRNGTAVIYITHRMAEIERLADRVTVLRDGEVAGRLDRTGIDRRRIISLMVGRPVAEEAERTTSRVVGRPVLRAEGVSDPDGRVRGVSLEVVRGEVVGLAGLMGAGRSEFARMIAGIDPLGGGRVEIEGQVVSFGSPAEAQRAGVTYLPEDRKRQGLFPQLGAGENITVAIAGRTSIGGVLRGSALRAHARAAVEAFSIRTADLSQPGRLLSGGNQQKLLFARALSLRPRLLILDEPTRGIDIGAKREIYRKIEAVAAEGVAVLVISSELPELLALCDRIAVLHEGRLMGVLDRRGAPPTPERIMALATGHAESLP
jgi:ribose transport system ATP-binding protein